MALRMGSYVFQFYQEIVETKKCDLLQPVFPILIYNGDDPWTAPENFRKLLAQSEIPKKYLPEFRYYKIAINEIPKRQLVELKNAVAAVFYIENSTPEEIEKNYKELIELLKYIFKYEGGQIVNSIVRWMQSVQKITLKTKQIKTIENITEVSTMWEAAVRRHEEALVNKSKVIEKQDILIDLCAIKFGKSVATKKKIRSVSDGAKLEAALRKILFSSSKSEVLRCLE